MPADCDECRVVITGRGVITPLGHSPAAIVNRWAEGASALGPIRSINADLLPSRVAAEITDFVAHERIASRKLLRMLQRGEDFAVAAAAAAFKEAGLTPDGIDPARSGISLGCCKECPPLENYFAALKTSSRADDSIDRQRFGQAGLVSIPPLSVLQGLPNMCLYSIAQLYRLEGHNTNFLSYGGGSALAIGDAWHALRRGDVDLMLAGGFDSALLWIYLVLYAQLGYLSRLNDTPEQAHRPFDVKRNGSVAGEGAGLMVLEEESRARRRGAVVLGEILACVTGVALDEGPDTAASVVLADCISGALEEARCRPEEIDLVHAHGDATHDGDRWEAEALERALGAHAARVPLTSLKSATGHLGNAAAAVELTAVLELMQRGIVPPILHLETPDPMASLGYVRRTIVNPDLKRTLLLSRGWPAQFSALVIGR